MTSETHIYKLEWQHTANAFEVLTSVEWLETNGLGGWAGSTVAGVNTRRYHGMLMAALQPPVGRTLVVSKVEETIICDKGNDAGRERYELGTNQYPGAVHPQGYGYLTAFERNLFPVFYYAAGGVSLKKTVAAVHGENTTLILYEVLEAPREFLLELLPLYAARDLHGYARATGHLNRQYYFSDGTLRFKNYANAPEVCISVPGSDFKEEQQWYYNFEHLEEKHRDLDHLEDLYSHGRFFVKLEKGSRLGVILSTHDVTGRDAFKLFRKELKRRQLLIAGIEHMSIKRLLLAADQFLVQRDRKLRTIIAGYHWFSDWGRDTMIALPGICLATGHHAEAKKILQAFRSAISDGMLPNRFPDSGAAPEYNTIDAALWFFQAVYRYYQSTQDSEFVKDTLTHLKDIIAWHQKGTRYHIHVDGDGLLYGGEEGTQLTWMDAKIDHWVVTPRRGKAVEINALWYNALKIMQFFFNESYRKSEARLYEDLAGRVLENFNLVFWSEAHTYLFDCIDGDQKDDAIRPNQLYAISLPFPLLSKERAAGVLSVVRSHLFTSRGMRTLSPSHPDYKGRCTGSVMSRDSAYHQGTVWTFLIGAYVDALIYVKGHDAHHEAAHILTDLLQHLDEACIGSISEIFDGDAPHLPRGSVAQAWSVAEILRVIYDHHLFDGELRKFVMSSKTDTKPVHLD